MATANVEIVVTTKTTKPGRHDALEELEAAVGHYLRHGSDGTYQNVRAAYIASRETA